MGDNVTLLLVDDLAENLVAMEALLRSPGLRCLTARSGEAALELLLVNEVALALVDVQMPDMDGFELAELMRGSERTKHVPIVFVTAGSRDRERLFQGYDSGAVDFLYKPIEPHILTNKVAVFVELFRQRQALACEVTERKQAQQQLQRSNVELQTAKSVAEETIVRLREVERLNRGFLSTASHELRTPLTSIRGSLGLLAVGALGALSQEALETIAVAERNAVKLMRLIDDILDVERLESGRTELQFTNAPVETILDRALESLATFGRERGVTVNAPRVSATVWADADRIVQVLVNLLSNAVKFSQAGGVVRITVELGEGRVEFRVLDQGRGVPAALRGAIFERFRQVEMSDSREKGGSGLGLAICKSIVEQHGGSIGVDSEEGQGSAFWFRVPTSMDA